MGRGGGDDVVEGEGSPNSVCQLLCDERASGSRNASEDACGQLLLHSSPRGGSWFSHKDTEDNFGVLPLYHQIMTINVPNFKLSDAYLQYMNTNCCRAFKCVFITILRPFRFVFCCSFFISTISCGKYITH